MTVVCVCAEVFRGEGRGVFQTTIEVRREVFLVVSSDDYSHLHAFLGSSYLVGALSPVNHEGLYQG